MQLSEHGLAFIKQQEGFRPMPYLCPAGKNTIGYGHVITADETFDGISETQASQLLKQDLKHAENAVTRLVQTPLTPNQFDALVSLTYNIGEGAFAGSTLLKLINNPPPLRAWRESATRAGWGVVPQIQSSVFGENPPPQPSPSRGEGVTTQFSRWIYAAGKPQKGLITRRAAEALLFTSPTSPQQHSSSPASGGGNEA